VHLWCIYQEQIACKVKTVTLFASDNNCAYLLNHDCCTIHLLLLFGLDSLVDDDHQVLGSPELLNCYCGGIESWRSEFVDDLPQQRQCLLAMTISDVLRCDVAEDLILSSFEGFQG
jgi:hypothetical protein